MFPPPPQNYGGLLDFDPEEIMRQAQFPGGVIPLPKQPFPSTAKVKGPSLASRVGNFLMPAPSGMTEAGLLSDEDIEAAQRQGFLGLGASLLADSGPKLAKDYVSPMAALGRGIQSMQGVHKGAVDSAMAMRAGAEEFSALKRKNQTAQGITAGRDAIIKKFPMPDTGNLAAMEQWISKVLPHFIEISDEETVGRLSGIYEAIQNSKPKPGQLQREPGTFVTVPGPDGKPRERYITQSQAGSEGIPVYEKPQRDTDDALTINSRILREQGLTKDFEDRMKGVQETADAFVSAKQAEMMGGAGDLQILYNFITALDPQSVVREGEIALARQSASLWSQAHILKNKFEKEGGVLSPVMRKQMIDIMGKMVELKRERADFVMKDTQDRASRFGLTVNLYDPLAKYKAWKQTQEQGGAPAAPAAGGVVPRNPGESISDYLKRTRRQ